MHGTNVSGILLKEHKTITKIHKLTQIPIKCRQLPLRVIISYFKVNY